MLSLRSTSMHIRHLRVYRENPELSRHYTLADKTTRSMKNCVVMKLELENGLAGWGPATRAGK